MSKWRSGNQYGPHVAMGADPTKLSAVDRVLLDAANAAMSSALGPFNTRTGEGVIPAGMTRWWNDEIGQWQLIPELLDWHESESQEGPEGPPESAGDVLGDPYQARTHHLEPQIESYGGDHDGGVEHDEHDETELHGDKWSDGNYPDGDDLKELE